MGDGCLMEGISHEAASLAGTLKLGKLSRSTTTTASRSTAKRMAGSPTTRRSASKPMAGTSSAMSTATMRMPINAAILAARAETDRPTLICCKTIIGFGAPQQARHTSRARRGARQRRSRRGARDSRLEPSGRSKSRGRSMPAGSAHTRQGAARESRGMRCSQRTTRRYPDLAAEFDAAHARRAARRTLPTRRAPISRKLQADGPNVAIAQGIADGARCVRPEAAGTDRRLGRSGRVQSHHLERLERSSPPTPAANYVYYGVREFGMTRDQQRPRAARRLHSVRRDVPGFLRLRAQRGAHGGADYPRTHPRVHPRFDRPWRRRPDPSADRASPACV